MRIVHEPAGRLEGVVGFTHFGRHGLFAGVVVVPWETVPHVLLVDDSPLARRVGRRLLDERGARTTEAGSRSEAEGAMESGAFDAALLDLELGDGTGVEVADALRARSPSCRIVFVSAASEDGLLEAARARGPVFAKPHGFSDAIDHLLGPLARSRPPAPSARKLARFAALLATVRRVHDPGLRQADDRPRFGPFL